MAGVAVRTGAGRSRTRGFIAPLAYLGAALVIAAALLPSALRPPPDEATTSAEFSPDAPPDQNRDAIFSSLKQAGSAGAGGGDGERLVSSTTIPKRAARGACFGDPPRQTDSFYATTCEPGWVGNNGGATAKGVTRDEFRIAWMVNNTDSSEDGPVSDDPPVNETDSQRAARVYQTYFNQRYEFFGRRMRIVIVKHPAITGEQEARAAVQKADSTYHVFGDVGISANAGALDEAVRRKLVTFIDSNAPRAFWSKYHPYAYSFDMDADQVVAFDSEMICKQLAGKPPSFNEHKDKLMDYEHKRVFGLILYEDQNYSGSEDLFNKELAKCGEHLALTIKHNLYDNQGGDAGAMNRMRAAKVTTVIIGGDPVTPVNYTNEAANSDFWPEWINVGVAGMGLNNNQQLYNQDQWKHSIGFFYGETPRLAVDQDYYRAYKSIDPGDTPPSGSAALFRELQMFANGAQGAGPKLTPDTFWDGLQKMPHRHPVPVWSVGGAFGPNDYTYADFMSLTYWDPDAQDPAQTLKGASRWLFGAKRFSLGEVPTTPVPFFKDTSDAVVTAYDADAYWKAHG